MTAGRPTREEVAEELGLEPEDVTPQVMAGAKEEPPECRTCTGPVVGPKVDEEARICFSCLDKIDRGIIEDPREDDTAGGSEGEQPDLEAFGL